MSSKQRLLELNARLAQNLTDNGVEATADETTTALINKVPSVYTKGYEDGKAEGGEFIGVKWSDFGGIYKMPKVVDARSLGKAFYVTDSHQTSGTIFQSLFENPAPTSNGGRYVELETVYLPSDIINLIRTFVNCIRLKTIIGDLSSVKMTNNTWYNCSSLTEMPYMPNLTDFGVYTFYNCTGLTSLTFYKVLTNWHINAITGCTNITEINLVDGWNINSYVQHCPNLTQASLHDMIEKYADMTGQTSPILNVGSTNLEKIDDEHKAMATAKNVTLA